MITVELYPYRWMTHQVEYSKSPWRVRRFVHSLNGEIKGHQTYVGIHDIPRRYKTEAGAQKAADKLNERTTND